MLTRDESAAAALVVFAAVAIVLAYLGDAIGLTLHPIPILLMSVGPAGAVAMRHARGQPFELFSVVAIVSFLAVWLLWLAWPHLLPIGGGSDLTHHLLLVDYIDRTGRLVHDRALTPYLGEMIDYTPGFHLLAVLAGRWLRSDGLHAVYPVVALSVALKAGFVFLIALRCVPFEYGHARVPLALVAPLLLFLPRAYFLGSFAHDSFLAQVVAELFAVATWWAIVCWDQQPTATAATIVGIAGTATFLTWPVWVGPVIAVFVAIAFSRRDLRASTRLQHVAIALLPIGTIAVVHAVGRLGATSIAGASGFAPIPTPENTGWPFPVAGVIGTLAASRDRRARTVPLLLIAIAVQAVFLVAVARARHAEAPYLALKMFYLAVYPLAVAGVVAASLRLRSALAWALVAVLAIPVGAVVRATPRPTPVITDALHDAGRWARTHVPPSCVDYLVDDDDSAYWLHLVELGNPRATRRSLDKDTFEPQKALVRWILPGGLPYAIAQDVDALPRDIRTNVDVLARFGSAAVIKRRGATSCVPGW